MLQKEPRRSALCAFQSIATRLLCFGYAFLHQACVAPCCGRLPCRHGDDPGHRGFVHSHPEKRVAQRSRTDLVKHSWMGLPIIFLCDRNNIGARQKNHGLMFGEYLLDALVEYLPLLQDGVASCCSMSLSISASQPTKRNTVGVSRSLR
jgi:hypothetical protein